MRSCCRLLPALLLLIAIATSCIQKREYVKPAADLDRLVGWMAGSFSSQEQSESDSAFFDIRLEMMPIWPTRADGPWLYVEQAVASALERPYRQRIYHLTQVDDTTFLSAVYEMDEPLRFSGAWRTPDLFDPLTPDSLTAREGCTIVLQPLGDTAFVGSTVNRSCLSDHGGASYATSEVEITARQLYSWDRGWDSTGTQVWGAEKGGYMFKKLAEE